MGKDRPSRGCGGQIDAVSGRGDEIEFPVRG